MSLVSKTDAVSSASISCSTCHTGAQSLTRNQVVTGIQHSRGATDLGVNLYISREKDYSSDALAVSVTRAFLQDNTSLSASYNFSLDRPHPHGWRNRLQKRRGGIHYDLQLAADQTPPIEIADATVQTVAVGWTQILSPFTLGQVNYELTKFGGYQQDPYHLISIAGRDYFERHPQSRVQHALSARIKQSISPDATAGADYRFYTDDWGVDSHTAQLDLYRYLSNKSWLLRLRYRYYTQSRAKFYRDSYDSEAPFVSNDDRLQAFDTRLLGFELSLSDGRMPALLPLFDHMGWSLGYDYYTGGSSSVGQLSSGRRIAGSATDLAAHVIRMELKAGL